MITSIEDNIISTKEVDYKINTAGLGWTCYSSMKKYKSRIAQVDALTGLEDSYDLLLKRCVRTALKMRSLGIHKGDIIAICTFNNLDCCIPIISAFLIGATVTTMDSKFNESFLTQVLLQIAPKMIFVDEESKDGVEGAVEAAGIPIVTVVFGSSTGSVNFKGFLKRNPLEANFKPTKVDIDTIAYVIYTHGCTGLPRGTCLSHRSILIRAAHLIKSGLSLDVNLCFTPLHWIISNLLLLASIMTGSKRIVYYHFDPNVFWSILYIFKVTATILRTSEIKKILRIGVPDDVDTLDLSELLIAYDGELNKQQMFELKHMLPRAKVFQLFIMTEAGGPITFYDLKNSSDIFMLRSYPSSCGKPIPGFSYKVVDLDTGKSLGSMEKGEMMVKGNAITTGFFRTDSSSILTEDGWIKTSMLVYYDDNYCFYFLRYIGHLIKFQDWFVSLTMIEETLMQHPLIKDAVVVGIPHESDTYHPFALVVLEETPWRPSPKAIMRYVERRVHDSHRVRGGVKIVTTIPKTRDGKKDHDQICAMVLSRKI